MVNYHESLVAAMRATVEAASRVTPIEIEGWGTVYVRTLTVADVEKQTEAALLGGGRQQRLADSAARIICDADGKQVFSPDNPDDVAFLMTLPWKQMQKVLQEPSSEALRAAETK